MGPHDTAARLRMTLKFYYLTSDLQHLEKIRQSLLPAGLEVKATETSLKEKQDRKGWNSDLVGEAEVW